jgi:hypothetical protein
LLNKSSCLARALGVTKFLIVTDILDHTLLCYLSQTYMFNKPTSESGLMNQSWCLAPAYDVNKFVLICDMN